MLKLYYWTTLDCLSSYGSGEAFALAHDPEEAIELIVAKYGMGIWPYPKDDEVLKQYRLWLREQPLILEKSDYNFYDKPIGLWAELNIEKPDVIDTPYGTYIYGSD